LPAFIAAEPEPLVALVAPLAPAPVDVLAPLAGEALLPTPDVPAEAAGEAAVELLAPVAVEAPPVPVPKVTAPIASCTLNGGGGTTGTADAPVLVELVPVEVLVEPVPLRPAEGATLLLVPVEVDVPAPEVLLPVLALPLAVQAALVVPPAALVAPALETLDGEAELTGDALDIPLAAGLVDAPTAVLAAGLVDAAGAVPVLTPGPELAGAAPPPPQAASRSEATARAGMSGFNDMYSSACPPQAGVISLM